MAQSRTVQLIFVCTSRPWHVWRLALYGLWYLLHHLIVLQWAARVMVISCNSAHCLKVGLQSLTGMAGHNLMRWHCSTAFVVKSKLS